jgi:hypothetical protein
MHQSYHQTAKRLLYTVSALESDPIFHFIRLDVALMVWVLLPVAGPAGAAEVDFGDFGVAGAPDPNETGFEASIEATLPAIKNC